MTDGAEQQYQQLRAAARAGRVAFSDFLEPADADLLVARLNAPGTSVGAWGGHAGARRRVVAAFPEQVPQATPTLAGWYVEGAFDADDLRAAAVAAGVPAARLGDAFVHQDGTTLITFAPVDARLLALTSVRGSPVKGSEVPLERLGGGSSRNVSAVVPSLRVDVLGARAFGVSRAYFAKGVAAGRVTINGVTAGKSGSAGQGDQVFADGLGRFHVQRVDGETRRGNLKVTLTVERH
jgi:RNA-binding protein YlmH